MESVRRVVFSIRLFSEQDYPALVEIASAINGDLVDEQGIRWQDANRDPRVKSQRWVAEVEGRVVASAEYGQWAGAYHPQRFFMGVGVHPEHRRKGIGKALYQTVFAALAPFDPITVMANFRENSADSRQFAANRGFRETMWTVENHLNPQEANLEVYGNILAHVAAQGYEIHSYTELAADPERDRKLYALAMETRRDIPSPEPLTDLPFEHWIKGMTSPFIYPDAYMISMKNGDWVGLSALWKESTPGRLTTGITAIKREHRGTGLAKALKVRSIQQARADGYTKIKTWNESNNIKMLTINAQLGFVRQPMWVACKLEIKPE